MILELAKHLTLDLKSIRSPNLVGSLDENDLENLGEWCWTGYDADVQSRANWFRRNEAGMDLAMQLVQEKSFPWPGCANVAFPLVTIATLQFHSRAYPELVPGKDLVQYEVWGDDPEGKEAARAARIGSHMSYQCLKEDEGWQDVHDKLMINYSVVGSAFTKTRRETAENKNKTDFVPARYLVMDYWAKSVESCGRKTHLIPLSRNEIVERVRKGIWKDVLDEPWYKSGGEPDQKQQERESRKDKRAGLEMPPPDDLTPFWFGEQHTYIDFDNDGYAEPVVITFELNSKNVVRVVYRFDREEDIIRNNAKQVVKIIPEEQFTRYEFIPSPDGGVYGLGWGLLVGPLNESVSTLVNQLLDSGTVNNTKGGFLARNAKLRGGKYTFSPFEWINVDVSGGTLKDSMIPLPAGEPSDVLFKLLGLLIDYSNRICSSTEMLAGENPGQNTPAQTSAAMVEQGMKIFASIFTRAWRCMKEEFKKLYLLNSIYTNSGRPLPGFASLEDYKGDPSRISPSADPTVLSEIQRVTKAIALRQAAYTAPGYDLEAVETYYLKALRVPNWQTFYKGPKNVPPLPNPKMMLEEAKTKREQLKLKQQQMEFAFGLLEEKRLNDAKILQLEAQAAKFVAEAGGIEAAKSIEAMKGVIELAKGRQELIGKQFDLMMQQMKQGESDEGGGESSGVRKVAGGSGDEGASPTPPREAGGGNGAMGNGAVHM
jgi:chaperonin GroES